MRRRAAEATARMRREEVKDKFTKSAAEAVPERISVATEEKLLPRKSFEVENESSPRREQVIVILERFIIFLVDFPSFQQMRLHY